MEKQFKFHSNFPPIFICLLLIFIIVSENCSQEVGSIKVTHEYPGWSLPFLVALDKGYFKKNRIKILPEKLEGSATLDFFSMDITNGHGFYLLKKQGSDPKIVKFIHPIAMKKDGDMVKGLLVKKSAGVKTWQDLNGKTIVTTELFSLVVLEKALTSHGLKCNPKRGEEGVEVQGRVGYSFDSLLKDSSCAAVYVWASDCKLALEEHPDEYLLLAKNLECEIADPYFVACTYINMKSFSQNPLAFRKYIKAIDDAIDFIRLHPKESLAIVPKYFSWTPEESAHLGIYHFYKSTEQIDFKSLEKSEEIDLKNFYF